MVRDKEKARAYQKQYRQKNKERIRETYKAWHAKNPNWEKERHQRQKEKRNAKTREYRRKNREKINEYNREYNSKYYLKNKEKVLIKNRAYNKKEEVKIKRNQKHNEKRKTDLLFKLKLNLRSRLTAFIKVKSMVKTKRTMDLIGCTPEELRTYLEKQFKPGMTWENYAFETWHIDHIKPLSLAKSMQDVIDQKLMHFTNLQPMWAKENFSKGNKINTK